MATDAAHDLAIRIEAKHDLHFFTRYAFFMRRGFKWTDNWHHKVICDALMRVHSGECKRLIINIPPRYSKTEIAVVNFMAWSLAKNPDCEFIHTSYSARLASNNAANTRDLVGSDWYHDLFPDVLIDASSTAKDHWKTISGGVVYSAGAGGAITGFGAGKLRDGFGGAVIIDDPHKADEATSEVMRQNIKDWFQNTIESRLNSKETPIIIIMQRLHEDDLSGWLLNGGNGEEWEHICLPAINKDGEPLWAFKHTIQELRRLEKASPYIFAGQYQQIPAPLDGGIFKPTEIGIIDALPTEPIKWVRGWDLAASTDGDYTAGAKIGRLADGRIIIADILCDQLLTDSRDAAIKNTASLDGSRCAISIPQDPGQAGKSQSVYFGKMLQGFNVKFSPETGDKVTRASPFASQVNVGNVVMLRGGWNDGLINEMRMFPNGKYDDRIDACSRAFNHLMEMRDPNVWARM